jgi:hypothetical protein
VIDSRPVTSFDGWAEAAGLTRLDVVKIDVEGSELDVLIGMERILRSLRPRLVIIEVIEENLRRGGSSPAELLELMADAGTLSRGRRNATCCFGPRLNPTQSGPRRFPISRRASRVACRVAHRDMAGGGFEPPKAEPRRLQRRPFDRSGTPPPSCRG